MQIEDGEHKNSTHEGNTTLQPGQTSRGFTLDLSDAFTPDPGAEDMFKVKDNKFAFSPGHLSKLLNPKSHNAFYALGGLAGLERGLSTDRSSGLSVDETNIENSMTYEGIAARGAPKYGAAGGNLPEPKTTINIAPGTYDSKSKNFWDRRRIFSENRLPTKKNKTLLQLAWQTYNDKVLILLTIAAVVSLALGLYQTFGGNMQRQFNQLNKKHDDRFINVVRSGKPIQISIFDILVGDVAILSVGDIVPVDGIFIKGHGVKCDESSATGESDLMKKTPADDVFAAIEDLVEGGLEEINTDKLDPFIISGTDRIAVFGGSAALLLFIVLFIKFLAQLSSNKDSPDKKGAQFLELFVVSVTVVVVAVPEGLPLAVTLALAFATTRMMKDHNLVRILKACETMGNATTICSDKTGTLTQNKMTVVAVALGADISFGGAEPAQKDSSERGRKTPMTCQKSPSLLNPFGMCLLGSSFRPWTPKLDG
ncbi:Calcium-transporting ATPase [Paramyrothecium foliicola]|nr:Calcium-transporting ATPase [Paramyrothecium foliicola]